MGDMFHSEEEIMMMRSIPTSLTSGRLYCKDEFVTEEI
jgi:hypothetical protein